MSPDNLKVLKTIGLGFLIVSGINMTIALSLLGESGRNRRVSSVI